MKSRKRPTVVIATSLAVIAILTLTPTPDSNTGNSFACVFCGDLGTADAILNLLLFIPLGLGLRLVGMTLGRTIVMAALLSGGIEFLQLFIPGRFTSLRDLLSNVIGCAIGIAIAATTSSWMFPSRRLADKLSLAWAVLVSGIIAFTGYLLQPSFPQSTYYGQWTPRFRNMEWYRGKILDARIDSRFIRSSSVEHSDSVRSDLLRGAPIEIIALAGPSVPDLAPLFSIVAEPRRRILLIGPDRNDLVYQFRSRAADFRLDQPALRVSGAMHVTAGDTLRIRTWPGLQGHCVSVNHNETCGLGFTAGTGWRLLGHVSHLSPTVKTFLNAGWIAILLLPFGYWARLTATSGAGLIVVVSSLLLVPAWSGLLPTPTHQWVAGLMGLLCGLWLRKLRL
ncbi:MAG: VanZ family protein [Gemmatimonadales bacterium]